jgi:hypothetical protein
MEARSLQGRTTVVVIAALVALGLGTTASVAAAGGNGPVSGIVIGITSESVEVQSPTGPVTVAITDKTRVIRTVSGTIADLRRGQIVELGLDGKSGRVAQIHIAPPGTKLPESNPGQGRGRGRGRTKDRGPARVLAHSAKTIRVRYGNGQVVTYRLVSKPSVIKDVPGRIGDITIGQTVLVTRSQGGRVANVITIVRG